MIDSQQFNQQFIDGQTPAFDRTYLFYGQTPFLSVENARVLVEAAKNAGFGTREIHYIDNRSKFQPILSSLQSPGLFDPKKVLELRFDTDKPTKKIGEQVAKIAQHQSQNLVIIAAGEVGYKAQKEKWFSQLQQSATVVVSKPIYPNQLPNWIHQRATQLNLALESEALKIIMRYSEGNLLWTNQILMQLANSDYEQPIKPTVVEDMLADLSVFQVDDLSQALFAKDHRALKIVQKLERENEPLVFITSVLQRDIDALQKISQSGMPAEQACRALGIWANKTKQRGYQQALSHYAPEQLMTAFSQLAQLDKINKGQAKGDGWLLLTRLVSQLVVG
ncbi:MAG: DNA polymerase III subunit delta [Gammaproteobacteria bacterium]|nr:MAG: DNA polymerase III subunit delta [Gammaproteobacteria bacterium]